MKTTLQLGPLLTSFLRDYEVDLDILNAMREAAIDHATLSKGFVPEEFSTILIEKWLDDGVIVRDRTFSEMKGLTDEENLLGILCDLDKKQLENFIENFAESVMGVVKHGNQKTEDKG